MKNIHIFHKQCILCLFIFFSISAFSQTSYFVKSGGTGDGSSWDSPLGAIPELSETLNNVHIYVAEGEYSLGTTTYSYTGNDVLFQGGFPADAAGTDLSGYNPEVYVTRITKPANDRLFTIGSTAPSFSNNKFTIKGIYYTNTGGTSSGNFFYATSNGNYQLKIEDCVIHDATASSGFIRTASFISTTAPVTQWIHNNKFYRNTMSATGPVSYASLSGDIKVLFSNNLVGEGEATDGTAFYATTVSNKARFYIIGNVFSCASATSTSAGIYLTTFRNAVIKNNVFLGVRGNNYGSAIFATASGGIQIEDNYFIQNYTSGTGVGAGGAIAIETTIFVGNIVTSNHIKNNFFYENKVNTTSFGGSAISLAGVNASAGAHYDIEGNVFAYNSALPGTGTNRQALIQTRANNIGNIRNNVFYGNKNSGGDLDIYAEIKASSASNVAGVIDNNKFQLANAAAYSGNNLQTKIAAGTNNTFGTTKADIADVEAGEFTIDCYTGSVGCFKIDDSAAATAKISKVGISTFKSQAANWPKKDIDGNDVNNGIMVLESNSKPLVVTRVKNPTKVLGTDAELKGAVAYDTEKKCLMLFDGEKWDCLAKGCDKSIYDVLESIKDQLQTP